MVAGLGLHTPTAVAARDGQAGRARHDRRQQTSGDFHPHPVGRRRDLNLGRAEPFVPCMPRRQDPNLKPPRFIAPAVRYRPVLRQVPPRRASVVPVPAEKDFPIRREIAQTPNGGAARQRIDRKRATIHIEADQPRGTAVGRLARQRRRGKAGGQQKTGQARTTSPRHPYGRPGGTSRASNASAGRTGPAGR